MFQVLILLPTGRLSVPQRGPYKTFAVEMVSVGQRKNKYALPAILRGFLDEKLFYLAPSRQ